MSLLAKNKDMMSNIAIWQYIANTLKGNMQYGIDSYCCISSPHAHISIHVTTLLDIS